MKPFLRISCVLLICVLSNGCKTSGNTALVAISPKVYSQQTDSLPLIPKYFLELETNSVGNCLVRGKSNRKVVALTFDDGPTNLSNKILDVLNKNRVKATFFWLGKNLADNREIIKKKRKKTDIKLPIIVGITPMDAIQMKMLYGSSKCQELLKN